MMFFPSIMIPFPSSACRDCKGNRSADAAQVEGEAQGESGSVSQLLKALDRGPTHAHVVKIEKGDMEEVGDEMGFQVLRRSAVRDVSHHRS